MDGLTPSELSMIHKLAGNDPLVRKKTMKKMKIWLKALSIKIPDTPDCREMAENNFIRVWKALFYCMWMADKPLPQEQLAEQISNLVELFASKPHVFNLFVEWFFRTMAREWPHIDRFRLDKFMMLTRRFLRKTFMVIEERKWKLDILDGFLKIVTFNIFNRRPETKSTRAKTREPIIEVTPFGLQSHMVDIFLEELAKAGGSGIKSQKAIKILAPFVNELAFNDDERMLTEIQERIFNHLMRQSDAGIDYAEGGSASGNYEDDEEAPEENGADDSEDDEMVAIPLDPRAGKVDVILPQIRVDYGDLAKKLLEVGGQKHVKPKNRKLCYTMAKKFQDVKSGSFPLAVDLEVPAGPDISRKDIDAAALRLLETEEEMTTHTRKNRKPKKQRIKEAKRRAAATANGDQDESLASENGHPSTYLEDEDLLEHVTDNYLSYLEEEHKNGDDHGDQVGEEEENGVAGLDKSFTGFNDEEDQDEEQEENQPSSSKQNAKKKKVKKQKYKTAIEVEVNGTDAATPTPTILSEKNQGRRRSLRATDEVTPTSTPQLSVKTNRRGSIGKRSLPQDNDDSEGNTEDSEDDTVVNIKNKNKFRKRSLNDTISRGMRPSTPSNIMTPGTPTSAKRKRVSFVLARNLEHPHADYEQSINRSPQLPFLPEKQPTYGLLKQKFTPTSPLATTPKRRISRI